MSKVTNVNADTAVGAGSPSAVTAFRDLIVTSRESIRESGGAEASLTALMCAAEVLREQGDQMGRVAGAAKKIMDHAVARHNAAVDAGTVPPVPVRSFDA